MLIPYGNNKQQTITILVVTIKKSFSFCLFQCVKKNKMSKGIVLGLKWLSSLEDMIGFCLLIFASVKCFLHSSDSILHIRVFFFFSPVLSQNSRTCLYYISRKFKVKCYSNTVISCTLRTLGQTALCYWMPQAILFCVAWLIV